MLTGPGLFGTHAGVLSDITLIIVLIVVGLFTTGFLMARNRNLLAHRRTQLIAFTTILIVALTLMVPSFRAYVLNNEGGQQPGYFYVITILHATLGAIGLLTGIYIVLGAGLLGPNVLPLRFYKPVMRFAFVMFALSAVTGILVYTTWYVIMPTAPGSEAPTAIQ
jgi:uncharacterized membrane protein YozB (DUF420 family)